MKSGGESFSMRKGAPILFREMLKRLRPYIEIALSLLRFGATIDRGLGERLFFLVSLVFLIDAVICVGFFLWEDTIINLVLSI